MSINRRIRLAHRIAVDGLFLYPGIDPRDNWIRECREDADKCTEFLKSGKATVVVVDNIAKNYAESSRVEWDRKEFPYCVPPFPATFFEWQEPAKWNFGNGPETVHETDMIMGSLGLCIDFGEQPKSREVIVSAGRRYAAHAGAFDRGFATALNGYYDKLEDGRVRWSVNYAYYSFAYGRCLVLPMHNSQCLDEDGMIYANIYMAHPSMSFDKGTMQNAHIQNLACSFLSCNNCEPVDTPEGELPDMKWQRRMADRVKGITFKTLMIRPVGKRQTDANGSHSQPERSQHICRGHFAKYTAERPLFGKYVGRFWIPAHVRGSASVGHVIKDYEA